MMNISKEGGSSWPTEATQYQAAQAGCQESLNRLLIEHEGLVGYIVTRQELYGLPYEEAFQAGRWGLWRAILGYDPQGGTQFSTYAYPAIIRQVWSAVRGHLRWVQRQVPEALLGVYFDGSSPDPARGQAWSEVCQSLLALVERLPTRQAEVIQRHYGLQGQARQMRAAIGAQLGVSQQRVEQIEQAALNWLRQPGHSQELRSLLERHTQAQYELAERLTQAWLRGRGGRRGQG